MADTVRSDGLFCLKLVRGFGVGSRASIAQSVKPKSVELWHRCMGHLGEGNLWTLEDIADGINLDPKTSLGVCEPCISGKQTKKHSKMPGRRARRAGELVYSDLCGPISP